MIHLGGPGNGRAKKYSNVKVPEDKTAVPAVVCVHAKNMKESWCLATSRDDLSATEIVALYGRRFTIEENLRDTKDPRFGLGLSATRVGRVDRRDRLLMIGALAQVLLTLLGAASEETGPFVEVLSRDFTRECVRDVHPHPRLLPLNELQGRSCKISCPAR